MNESVNIVEKDHAPEYQSPFGWRTCISTILSVFFLAFALTGTAVAQTWIEPTVIGGPPSLPIYQLSMVRDTGTNRAIVYGRNSSWASEVWVLTNSNGLGGASEWIKLNPTGVLPPSRGNHSAVYDYANNRMIIFGGCGGGCYPVYNDVWVLSNANGLGGTPAWIQLYPSGFAPNPRHANAAAYDPASNRMIIFAGHTGGGFGGSTYSDVWVLSNANGLGGSSAWTKLYPVGGPPLGQYSPSFTHDAANNRLIVTGGAAQGTGLATNAVWVLSNANGLGGTPVWSNVVPEGAPGSPPLLFGAPASYDSSNNRMMILRSGTDEWVLSNANGLGGISTWTQYAPSGGPPDGWPWWSSAVYDSANNRAAVLFHTTLGFEKPWVLSTSPGDTTPPVVTVGGLAFDPPFVISTGSRVLGVTSGDYNNDGFADLASVNLDSNTFSVYLGDGSGGFSLSANVAVATGPSDISSGDFNNDGNLDLVVSSYNANAVVSYLGNGDGTFQHISTVPISINPSFAIPFDFNNDGNLDLISGANNGGWQMYVLQGAGDGTFTIASSFGGGLGQHNPREPAIADFNGDGYVDLLIPATISYKARLFTNDGGAGTFTNAGVKVSGISRLEGAISGDFNHDGFADLAISMASLDTVRVMLGDGAGGFSSTTDYATVGTSPNILRTADMNGDSVLDIVVSTHFPNGGVSVFLGNGDGTFQAATGHDTAAGANYVTLADFNGDGRLDIATAHTGGIGFGGMAVLLSASADITVEATGPLTAVTIGPATAYDLQDGILIPTADQSGPFAVGTYTITWSATDAAGNTGTATQSVTVTDTTAPVITVPADVTVEATASLTPVLIASVPANDLVDGLLSAMPDNVGPFPVGTTVVTYSVTDNAGNTATATQNVTVTDTTAPAVMAQLIPIQQPVDDDKDDGEQHSEGLFKVVFTASDIADANPTVTATLNGQTVTNGQIVKLERDDEAKAEFEHGKLEIAGMSFMLNVSAIDASGNTGSASDAYVFPAEHADEDKPSHDKDD